MANNISQRDRLRTGLMKMFEIHLDEYVSRLIEVGGFGVGGITLEVSLPFPTKIHEKQEQELNALCEAIQILWQNSALSYIYGNFRACIFQLGSMLEGTLKLEILRGGLKKSLDEYLGRRKPTLGNLIGFCKKNNVILSRENNSLDFAERINNLRVEHIHLILEQERPDEVSKVTPRDELVSLEEFKGKPPVKIKNGWISGDGVTVIFDFVAKKAFILYKYKKDAKKCLNYAKQILKIIY